MDQNVKKNKFYCLDAQHCTGAEREESTFLIFSVFSSYLHHTIMLWTKATYDSDPQSLLNTLVVVT